MGHYFIYMYIYEYIYIYYLYYIYMHIKCSTKSSVRVKKTVHGSYMLQQMQGKTRCKMIHKQRRRTQVDYLGVACTCQQIRKPTGHANRFEQHSSLTGKNVMYSCHTSKGLLKHFLLLLLQSQGFFTGQNAKLVEKVLQIYVKNYKM